MLPHFPQNPRSQLPPVPVPLPPPRMGPTTNFTIEVPVGTTNHNDPHLICTPATHTDLFVFFVTNYLIHAASLPAVPGETLREKLFTAVNALFIPGFGAGRTIRHFALRPKLKHKQSPLLQCAARAGALCMVVHKTLIDFRPRHAPRVSWGTLLYDRDLENTIVPTTRVIHGVCKLPSSGEYRLAAVPFGTPLQLVDGAKELCPVTNYNVAKALFSLVQAVAGSITIYRARGDQIARYGYGAFGLSVVPYVFMSVVNIVASFLAPEYPAMYLVRTPDMTEAEKHGGEFSGIVAQVDTTTPTSAGQDTINPMLFLQYPLRSFIIWLVLVVSPLGIVGALSGFRTGYQGTSAQRGWIMSWLVVGSISSCFLLLFKSFFIVDTEPVEKKQYNRACWRSVIGDGFILFLLISPFWVPAIGGMVIVTQGLREYGICQRFD